MKNKTYRKLVTRIALIMILVVAMTATTYAYVNSVLRINDNTFQTGLIDIDLNGGRSVVEDIDLIEPGATYIERFYLKNNSSDLGGVYYKLYFKNVSGYLATVLEVSIFDADNNLLISGTMNELMNENVDPVDDLLRYGETKWYTIKFHYPEEAGNAGMGTELTFTLAADAVQTKNNPDKSF